MAEFPTDYEFLLKIVLVGDPLVGKSYILSQYIREDFDLENKKTIGVEFDQKFFPTPPGQPKILVQLWDSEGQERFLNITPNFFRAATGALLVFDVTKQQTLQNCEKWYQMIKENADQDIQIILVANKVDLNNLRIVSTQQGQEFANSKQIKYIEVSALTGENIQNAISSIVQDIHKLIAANPSEFSTNKNIELNHKVDISQRNRCCGTGGMV